MSRKQKKRVLRTKRREWYKRWLRRQEQERQLRPTFEALEPKLLLSGATYYADDFQIYDDVNSSGTLDAGDIVTLDAFGGGTAVFGTDAFDVIQDAVNAASADDIIQVGDGTFVGNVTIDKDLTLLSQNGYTSTTIQGVSGFGNLGAVTVTNATTDVQIGDSGQGFTIVGIDNGAPGVENAAVYFQGGHSGAVIRGNEIVANGDHGLLTEYGATIDNFVIDGNIFSGQTFVGANPAGDGFSAQFSLANVPRQLVTMGGGTGGGNTSNITFTNNQVVGTAGGTSLTDNTGAATAAHEQGNTLVTIDSSGAVITGNTFAGTTQRYGSSLRARGSNVVITGNTFDASGQTATTNYMYLANGSTANGISTDPTGLGEVVGANIFATNAVAVEGGNTVYIASGVQATIDASAPGFALRFAGTFTEDVDVNQALLVGGDFVLNGTLTLSVAGATLSAGYSPGIISSGDLTLTAGSILAAEVNGLTAGTEHDQYVVTGTVDLGGATLNASGTINASIADSLVLIDNDGVDAITGTFAGLAQGDTLVINSETFLIDYTGGDGNDVELIRVPAAVSELYVDDDWAGTAFGDDPDGAGPAGVFGYNAFATIQEAIDAAVGGAVINVLDGTYNEALSINKSLDLIGDPGDALEGEGAAAPVLDGTSLFGVFGATITGASSTVLIDGFTFANWFTGGVSVEDGHVTLSDSTIDGPLVGVSVDGGSATVDASILTNAGIFGVEIVNGGSAQVVGSQITNANTAGVSASAGSADISESVISGNATGVLVGATGSATVFGSSLAGNTVRAISNSSATKVNASGNYWGSVTQAGVAAQTLGLVDFSPFLVSSADTDAAAAGFQGDFSTVHVTTLGSQSGSDGRLQEAVDMVDAGGTVFVLNGLYKESNATIRQSLTLEGQSRAGVIIAPEAVDDHSNGGFTGVYQQGLIVAADNVTIQTLTIDGEANATLSPNDHNFRMGITTDDGGSFDNLHVDDVTIQNVYRRGIYIGSTTSSGHIVENSSITDVTRNDGIIAIGEAQFLYNTISNVNGDGATASAAAIRGYSEATFIGNNISNALWGIVADTSATIQDNVIDDVSVGIVMNNLFYDGTNASASFVTIQGNQITNIRDTGYVMYGIGMSLVNLADGSMIGGPNAGDENTIDISSGTDVIGMNVWWNPGEVTIQNNQLTVGDQNTGILVQYTPDLSKVTQIVGNTIQGTGRVGTGILLTEGEDHGNAVADISDNDINDLETGIELALTSNDRQISATLSNNSITNNDLGLKLSEYDADTNGYDVTITSLDDLSGLTGNDVGILVDGGSLSLTGVVLSGNDIGLQVDGNGEATLTGGSISATTAGAQILGSGLTLDGVTISGAATGIDQTAGNLTLLNSFVNSNTTGVSVDNANALIEGTDLTGNSVGIHVSGDAQVDAGGGGNTGLGTSAGGNTLTGYTGLAGNYAIENLNQDAAGNVDVYAQDNNYGTNLPVLIENVVYHTVDDAQYTEVLFSQAPVLTAPTIVYVDDDWAGTALGVDADGAGGSHGDGTGYGYDQFATISDALAAVVDDGSGEVRIYDGTYGEQLLIDFGLVVTGESELGTVIQAPPVLTLDNSFVYSGQTKQSVVAVTSGDVTIQTLTVDGNGAGNAVVSGNDFDGIGILNADVTIDNVTVTGVRDSLLAGTQRGRAIFAGVDNGGPYTITVTDSTIEDYQKNGIDLRGAGLTADITGNEITGSGDVTVIAQNGIVLLGGATGTISGNTISDHMYSGTTGGPDLFNDWQSTGILLYDAGSGVVIDGNTIDANDIGIYSWGGTVQISNNILGSSVANRYEGILVDQSTSDLTGNHITGGNMGIAIVAFSGSGGNSEATLTGNTISGAGIGVQMIDDDAAVDPVLTVGAGNTISGGTTGLQIDGAGAQITGLTLNDLAFTGQSGDYVTLLNGALDNLVVDASAVTVDGTVGASLTPAQLAAAEAKITDELDDGTLGRIQLQGGLIVVTPTLSPTATDNDYIRIKNAAEAATAGDTIMLLPNGADSVFNWDEANALASWELGNDGVASTDDDWGVLLPDGLNDVTVTANTVDNISIQGPGDVTSFDLEGVFLAFDNGTNTGWTFENFGILDFDNAIGFYYAGDDYSDLTVNNMHIRVAADDATDSFQNIGIHYGKGTNISITNNLFELVGGGDGATFAIQSNTHGGTNYDGLNISGNDIVVLNAGDEIIYGIWENGHAHQSNITVSGNTFTGIAGNTGTQVAFRVSSHSGASSTVSYDNNTVDQADVAFDWLDIYYGTPIDYTGTLPVEMNGNIVTNSGVAYDIGGIMGSANINGGSVTGASGIGVQIADGNSATVTGVTLENLDIGVLVGGSATIIGNSFDNANDNLVDIQVASTASGITIGAGNTFGGDDYYIENLSGLGMNLVGLGSSYDEVDNFRIEDRMYHATDNASSGLIRVVADNLYVTTPGTGLSDELIQNAVNVAAVGDTVNVEAGTFNEDLLVSTEGVKVIGQGQGVTIIDHTGQPGNNNAGVYLSADDTELRSLSVTGNNASSTPRYGVKVADVDGVTIDSVTVSDSFRTGLDVLGASNITINNLVSENNGGAGIFMTDVNGASLSNITTSNNPWVGISIATWGRYTPLGTSGIVFSGTNSFGETATDNGGMQLEMGNYNDPLNPELITWSSNPADSADVTFLSADFGYALSGPTSDNDNLYTRFYQTLGEAEAAAAGSPDHIAANDRYIQEADDSNSLPNSGPTQLYVFDDAGNTMSIQAAVDAAVGGDTINVAAGTFEGTVDANKSVTIDGQGLSSIIDAGGAASHGVLVHADDLVLSNLRITNANDAVRFDAAVDGVQLLHVQADNAARGVSVQSALTDLTFDDVTLTGNGTGMRVATLGAIVGFDLLNSAFDGNDYGMTVYASGSITNNEANFTDILIQNTSFSNNLEKGFYTEKLDNATLDNVTVDSSGTGGAATYDSGIDINLKYGTYTNIDILGGAITNSGTGDAVNGTGLTIKARGTGNDPSYASNPATLTDVVIDGTTISGNQVGIRIGEPGKANTGPSGVLVDADVSNNVDIGIAIVGGQVAVQNTDLTGNQVGVLVDGGATADLGGGSLASVGNNDLTGYSGVGGNYAIEDLNLAAQPDVYADNNSFGSTVAGVIESIVFDDTDDATRSMVIATNPQGAGVTSPIYVDDDWAGTVVGVDPDGVGGVSAIYGIDAFANINDALDAVSVGGEIIVFAGTYNERFDLDQSVNLHSDAYAGTSTSGRTAGDASEAIIDLQGQEGAIGEGIRITSSDVTFAGFDIIGGSATNYGIYIAGGGNNLDNIAIENNFIHGMALPNPVVVGSELTYGILGDSNGVSTWGELSNLSIVGNEIYDLGSAGTASGYGINLYDVNGATITGNALHDLADGLNDVGTGVSVTFAGSGANPLAGVSSNVTIANDSYANMSVGVRLLADSGSSVTQDVADFSNVELYVVNAGDLPRASVNLTGQHVWTNDLAVSAAIQGYLTTAGITEPTAGYTGSIQTAIDQSNEDATVTLTAGTFAENVTIDKDINLVGQGSSTLWTPSGSGNIVTIAGSGFGDDQTVSIQDIDFDGQSGTANAGVYVGSAADFANLSITNGDFTGFNYYAIAVFGDASTGISVQDVDLTSLTFSNNGIAGSGGTADIQIYEYNGDATLSNLVHVGNRNEGAGSGARSAIQFRGVGAGDGTGVLAGGNIVLDDIEVTGTYRNQFIGIQRYTDVSNFSFNDVVLGGGASDLVGGWGATLRFDAVGDLASKGTATPASVDLGNTYFRGIVSSIIGLVFDIEFAPDNNFAWLRADGTNTQWDTTTGTQVAASSLTLDELFEVEDRILHYVEPDHPSHLNSFHGFVEVVDGTAYITDTFSSLINRGIEVVDEGGTVFIDAGSYVEDVNVNRYVNLDGAGSGSNPAVDTVITPASSTYGLAINASGLDAANRLTVQDLHVTGSASHGVAAYGQDHIEILNVESSGNDLDGFHLSDMDDLVITDSTASNNGAVNPPTVGHGFDLNGVRDAVLTNLTAVDNYSAGIGISARASTTGASSNIDIIGGTFSDGSSTRPEGSNGISLYVDDAHGASSISDVTIGGTVSISDFLFGGITLFNAGVTSTIDNIQIGQTVGDSITLTNNVIGLMMFGNVTNVDADADFVRGASSASGVSALGLDETGTLSPNMISVAGSTFTGFDNTAPAISLAAVNPSPAPAYFVSSNTIDVTGATFDGVDPGTLSTGDPAFWTIEDQIVHAIDVDGAALIDFDPAGNHYLTTSSFVTGINTNAKVQRAVDVATAGDTIFVQDGTYVEGSQVVIDKDLTIDGQSRVGTILTPGYDTSTSGNARGWWLVNAGIDLDVSSLTYDGTGNSVWQAVRHLGTGSFDDVAFTTIQYSASGSPYAGTGIAAFGGVGAVDVTNSYFDTIGRIGMQYFGAGTTGTFSGNTYTGKGVGDFLDYAVEVGAGAIANINNNIITDNLGVAASDGSTSAGVLVTTYFGGGTEAHLSGNQISNSTSGVAAGYDGTDTSIVTLTGDTLDGNEYGVSINGASVSINAGTTIQNGTTGVDVDSNGSVTIDGATISGNAIGVDVGSTGSASITNSDITGTAGSTGVLVSAGGSASIVNNPTTITGHEVGIDVDGGTALIENNDLNGNTIGVLIQNGGIADLGDNTGSDITGLGTGSGTNGSSAGLNDFGGYTTTATASSGAIVNLNNDGGLVGTQGLPPDIPAFGNTWNDPNPSAIENVVYHDNDDNNLGFVDFADLLSLSVSLDAATIDEGGSVQLLGTFTNSPQDHTLTVDWGDGNTDIIAVPAGVFDLSTLSITHTYDDNGPVPSGSPYVYAIGVTLEEDTGPGVLTDNSLTATVNNVAPTVALSGAATTDEADLYTLTIGAVTDPGDDTVIQYRVMWGDGSFDVYTAAQIALMSGMVTHTYQDGPGGVSQISVELTDEDGIHANAGTLPLSVNNLDPFGTFDNGGPVDAGTPGFVTWYAQGDPSPVDASSLVYDYDFGDDGTYEIIGSSLNFATVPGLYLTTPGMYDVRGKIRDKDGGSYEQVTTITVNATTFRVLNFTTNASGFDAVFSGDLDMTVFNLYDSYDAPVELADLYVVDTSGEVAGSAVFDTSSNKLTWVKTGGVLEPGNYTVFMVSGPNAMREAGTGALLDGNSDGTPGDNYVMNFTVTASTDRVLSLPDFARGPGQTVDVPATGLGLPVTLDDATNVNAVDFDVIFDATLLNITGVSIGASLPGDWSVTYNMVAPGYLKVTASGITTLSGTDVEIVNLTADVPSSADFGGAQVIRLESVAVNGGFISSVGDRALHKAAYLGDVDGDFFFSGLDASLISGVVVDLVTGFDAFDKTDPVILANSTGTGTLNGLDASYVAQKSVALPRPEIPDLPAIAPAGVPGEDPNLTVASGVVANIGATVSLPISIDDADGLLGFNMDLAYDTNVLDITNGDVSLGSLLSGAGGWNVVANVDDVAGTIKLAFYRADVPMPAGGGEVATLDFTVLPGAASIGTTYISADGPTDLGGLTYNYFDGSIDVQPISGDLNSDGFVGLDDLDIVLSNWNQNVTAGDWLSGDPSGDGYVGLDDLDIVLNNWNAGTPPVAQAASVSEEEELASNTSQQSEAQSQTQAQTQSQAATSQSQQQQTQATQPAEQTQQKQQQQQRQTQQQQAHTQQQTTALSGWQQAPARSAFGQSEKEQYEPTLGLWESEVA